MLTLTSGVGKVAHFMEFLDTKQYLDMRHEAFLNDGATPQSWDYDLTLWDTTRYTDWQKLLIGGTAHYTDLQSSISGGNQNTQFLLAAAITKKPPCFRVVFRNKKVQ